MKTIITMLALSTLVLPISAPACKILLQAQEEIPAVHAETLLVLQYHKTHRNCAIPLSTIKVTPDGMIILSATAWEEVSAGTFQRKFKVRIESSDCSLKISRPCPKGGLNEKIVVQVRSGELSGG
jgi:hypothetical protein